MPSQILLPEIAVAAEEESKTRREINASAYDTARPWCIPSDHVEIVGADFGGGSMHCHLLRAGRDIIGVPLERVRESLLSLPRGTLVVSERAHLATPQTDRSLAQPFTAEQLIGLYDACAAAGVTIRLFPQAHSRKAREWAAVNAGKDFVEGGKTSDINDARALAFYVAHCNSVALSKPPTCFSRSPARDYGALVRSEANIVLRAVKVRGYEGQVFSELAALSRRLHARVHRKCDFVTLKVSFSIVALVAGVVDGETVRFTYKGNTPGRNFWLKKVLMCSSLHHRGGVARANMFRDRFRPFLAEFAAARGVIAKQGMKYVPFGSYTRVQELTRRDAWRDVRKQLRDAYSVAVTLCEGLPACEILDTQAGEVLDGR